MGEKLLTKSEAAQLLEVPEAELERLVTSGLIEAYRLGGQYLRFRRDHLLQYHAQHGLGKATAASVPARAKLGSARSMAARHGLHAEGVKVGAAATWLDRVRDFFYFNDFYLAAGLLVAGLLFILFR